MSVLQLTGEEFDEIIKTKKNLLVDFWAPWCGPCQAIGSVLEEAAREYEGKMDVLKVNVDDHTDLATRFGVLSIPTLLLFKNGEMADKTVGAMTKSQLISWIDNSIN